MLPPGEHLCIYSIKSSVYMVNIFLLNRKSKVYTTTVILVENSFSRSGQYVLIEVVAWCICILPGMLFLLLVEY